MTERPLLAASVVGWSAVVVDVLLKRHLRSYLATMNPAQRAEVERVHRAIHLAALEWRERVAAEGSAEAAPVEIAGGFERVWISAAGAAGLLALSARRVRQLAELWVEDKLARKVGRVWLIDREAVELYRRRARRAG